MNAFKKHSFLTLVVMSAMTLFSCAESPSQSELNADSNANGTKQVPSDVTIARYDAVRENLSILPRSVSARERLIANDSVRVDFGKHSIYCQKNSAASELQYVCDDVPRGAELINVYVGQALFLSDVILKAGQVSLEL